MSTSDASIDEVITWPAPAQRLALVVGSNNSSCIPPNWPTLHSAEKDARDVAYLLERPTCGFKLLRPAIVGEDATVSNIRHAMQDFVKGRTEQDFLLFYFSGHAQQMKNNEIFFVTYDFDKENVELDPNWYLSMRWLWNVLYQAKGVGGILIILDCCYAGNMSHAGDDLLQIDLRARLEAWDAGTDASVQQKHFRFILAATGYNGQAEEIDGHGQMTKWLLRALEGDERIMDAEGNADVYSIHRFLLDHLQQGQISPLSGESAKRCILARHPTLSASYHKAKEVPILERILEHVSSFGQHKSAAETNTKPKPQFFDKLLCNDASFNDLDPGKVADYLRKELVLQEENFLSGASDHEQLIRLGLLRNSHSIYGALLCFGKEPSQWIPSAITRCIDNINSNDPDRWEASKKYRKGLLRQFDESFDFLIKRLNSSRVISKEGSVDQLEIPPVVLREALANALIHRDYEDRTDCVVVEIYSDRIEIGSPGDLPRNITLENLLKEHGSHPRNPQIAEIFHLYGLVEERGKGIERMARFMAQAGLQAPEFNVSSDKRFKVTLYRPKEVPKEIVLSENFGELVSQGIHKVAKASGKSLDAVKNDLKTTTGVPDISTIERCQQGFIPTRQDLVTALARVFVQQGGMNKEWLETFLKEARYLNPELLIAELFPKASLILEEQNRLRMLGRLSRTYSDLLAHSLQSTIFLELGLMQEPEAVRNTSLLLLQSSDQPGRMLPVGTSITQAYDEAGHELLILGEPGAGKSTLLLYLAQELVNRAEQDETHPFPIILPLSSWAIKRQPLDRWLSEQIAEIYNVPRRLIEKWVSEERVLPLLDGLDEMDIASRSACISAINAYHQHHLVPLVVCGRKIEYETAAKQKRLSLQNAVVVQPLSPEQVDVYLAQAGKSLGALRYTLSQNPLLQELARTPLMLSVLTLTYQGTPARLTSRKEGELQQQILSDYVERMVERKGNVESYPLSRIYSWLHWLAQQMQKHNQNVFYLEHLQPDWLPLRQRSVYESLAVRLPAILIGILVGILILSFLSEPVSLLVLFQNGILGGFLGGLWSGAKLDEGLRTSEKKMHRFFWGKHIALSIFIGLLFGCSFVLELSRLYRPSEWLRDGLIYGSVIGLSSLLLAIASHRISSTRNSYTWRKESVIGFFQSEHGQRTLLTAIVLGFGIGLSNGLESGLSNGLSAGLGNGLNFGLVSALISLILGAQAEGIYLYEGLRWSWGSLRRALFASKHLQVTLWLACIITILSGLSFALSIGLGNGLSAGLSKGLSVGFSYWFLLGLFQGISQERIEDQDRQVPNQGIRRSFRNSVFIGILGCGMMEVIVLVSYVMSNTLSVGLINALNVGLSLGALISLCGGILISLISGGLAILRHYMLRLLLWRSHTLPWRLLQFLNDSTARILLRRVGGGYNFIHRLLLDYFANLD